MDAGSSQRARQFPGTGLPVWMWASLLVVSVALFIVWGGLLWSAPRQASHVMRFVVSYLSVIPLALIFLALVHRLNPGHLMVSVGTVWCVKMLVTAILFQAFARGTGQELHPAAPPLVERRRQGGYEAARGLFVSGSVHGFVLAGDRPIEGAVVWVNDPRPGRAISWHRDVELEITHQRYAEPLYTARSGDVLIARNSNGVLHTVHLHGGSRSLGNLPLPPGASAQLVLPEPGVFVLRCDNHPAESAWLITADHPYLTRTDAAGGFTLSEVPAGPVEVIAFTAEGQRAAKSAVVESGAATDVTLQIPTHHAENR